MLEIQTYYSDRVRGGGDKTAVPEAAGSEVRVLNSAKLPFIRDAPTKTDKEDAMKLAHLTEERRIYFEAPPKTRPRLNSELLPACRNTPVAP
jgi:hypothetical protein